MRALVFLAAALLAGSAVPALACPGPAGVVRTIFPERPADLPPGTEAFAGRWAPGASEPPAPGWGVPVGWLEQGHGRRLAVYSPVTSCHHDFRRDFGGAEVWIVGRPLLHEGRVVGLRARGRGRNGTADWSGRRG
ncbi:hypothetical protein [Brevundimonas viscosa]|uniref:Uncharacterized protein n=1 Tax=Brevundimonas viscosa TaxID=871741 RepID=A0A1I6PAV3_9CAUL|nr:hypothetical protein [Brevundimonas viscosa]SFS37327.1 hypothetical protein SAMN05192570_0993 [Brevundimonas viscosa]